jgi:hypothetical protein
MVHLWKNGDTVQIVFTEAKLFSNTASLRADPNSGKPAKIFKQIDDYEKYITLHEKSIRHAYHQVNNPATMSPPHRQPVAAPAIGHVSVWLVGLFRRLVA